MYGGVDHNFGTKCHTALMKLLFIGGTRFVGRAIAEAAIARGHDVTLFHRGSGGAGIIQGAKEIFGDREQDLEAIRQEWDAVVDTCGYVPRVTNLSGQALKDFTKRYLFISTISVYAERDDDSLFVPDKPKIETEELDNETYGPLKVECELGLRELYGDRLTVVRPGIIAGPYDPTNRLTYWVERFAFCNDVLVPDQLDQPIQVIDARDLGDFTVQLLEEDRSGIFDAVGPKLTLQGLIDACNELKPDTEVVLSPLEKIDAKAGADLPLILIPNPEKPGKFKRAPMFRMTPTIPIEWRPISVTIRDTYRWCLNRDRSKPEMFGMTRDREVDLIQAARRFSR